MNEEKHKKNICMGHNWKDALRCKAIHFKFDGCGQEEKGEDGSIVKYTFGYRLVWTLWSADVFFNRIPLFKTLIFLNMIVWLIVLTK
jgi:hypothetical protein